MAGKDRKEPVDEPGKDSGKDTEADSEAQPGDRKPAYTISGRVPRIETDIDRLYGLVKEKGSISVSDAAKKLGTKPATVMEWGDILEDHGMVELHYPVSGKPSLRMKKPAASKGNKSKKEKHRKPRLSLRKRFTKKVIMIYIEIIVLGELLIYIFFVNRYLSMNFLPTIQFHFNGFLSYLSALPAVFMSGNLQVLLDHPLYLALSLVILVVIILIIVATVKSRRKGPHPKKHGKGREKPEHEKIKAHVEGKKAREWHLPGRERGREPKAKPKSGKKENFADVIERHKKRLREME